MSPGKRTQGSLCIFIFPFINTFQWGSNQSKYHGTKAGSSSSGLPFADWVTFRSLLKKANSMEIQTRELCSPEPWQSSPWNRDRIVEKRISGLFQPSLYSVTLLGCLGCIWLGGFLSVYYSLIWASRLCFPFRAAVFTALVLAGPRIGLLFTKVFPD